jgi:hypothetical protein
MFIPLCKGFTPILRIGDKCVSFRNSAGNFNDCDQFFLKCNANYLYLSFRHAIFVIEQQYYEQFTRVEIIFCVLQSNYMSRLRRFFLVFVCFGYLIVDYFLCIAEQLYEQVTQILFSVRLFC